MRKRALLALCLFALALLTFGQALADNGPHGGYTAATDACAGCHRAHTAAAGNLLVDTVPNLCYTCHGSSATGAATNVVDGLYTPLNRSLRGGGFTNVTMNPEQDLTGSTVQNLPVTSNHMINGGANTVWGYGAISGTANPGAGGVSLTCTNCHNPHGRAGAGSVATYRILKGNNPGNTPLFGSQIAFVDIPDQATKTYYTSANGIYFGDHGASVGGVRINAVLTSWCAQCHTRYHAPYPATPGSTNSGDAIYQFRHVTNDTSRTDCGSCHPNIVDYYPGCVTCHMSHGTGVRMGDYSGAATWPDGSTSPSGNNRSSLLKIDNRGVCWQCHVDKGISFP